MTAGSAIRPATDRRDAPSLAALFADDEPSWSKAEVVGTHRTRPLTETLALAWSCRRQVGVSRVADVTELDIVGIPVVNTIRPLADEGNLTVTCGKGLTMLAAATSAMMEAVERHCGEQHGREGLRGSFRDLREERSVLPPRSLVLRRDSRWTPDSEIEWWPATDLVTGEEVLVPAAAVFTPYHGEPRLIGSHSDGLAAGNCRIEAVLHGLYELIERDCTTFGTVLHRASRVDLATLPPEPRMLVDRLDAAGLRTMLFVFLNELRVPACYAIIDDVDSDDGLLVNAGAGCHLDPTVAACRALTEAAQSRLSIISGGREDLGKHQEVRDEGYEAVQERLRPWQAMPAETDLRRLPNDASSSILADLTTVRDRMVAAGFGRVLVVDVTIGSLPFSVCRTIVPGFEFFHHETQRLGLRLFRALAGARAKPS